VNCLVLLQWSVLMAGYRCTEQYALGMLWVNCIRIVEGASVFIVLFSAARPPQLAALMLLISLGGTAWLMVDLRRRAAWLSFGVRHARWERIRQLWRPAAAFMAIPAANAISTQGMTMLVGVLLGPLAVAVYNPMRTLARVVLQLSNAVSNSFWPELSAAFGQNNLPLARKLHRSACQVALTLAFFGMVTLALAGPRIFAVWTHGRIALDAPAFYVLLLSTGAYAAWNASAAVPLAANRHQGMALVYLACTTGSLVIGYFLARPFGLTGVAVAGLLCDLAMSASVMGLSNRILEERWPDFRAGLLDPAAMFSVGTKLTGYFKRK
jgi:O-antigen/teichoic acid export membrane protein